MLFKISQEAPDKLVSMALKHFFICFIYFFLYVLSASLLPTRPAPPPEVVLVTLFNNGILIKKGYKVELDFYDVALAFALVPATAPWIYECFSLIN